MASIYLSSAETTASAAYISPGMGNVLAASLSTAVALLVIGQGPEIIASSVSSDSAEALVSESVTAGGVGARFVLNDILHLWGCACDTTDDCIQADAVGAINAAMQYIHANGKELPYLTKRTRVYGVVKDTGKNKSIVLEADVQNVCGYVRAVTPQWISRIAYRAPGSTSGLPSYAPFNTGNTLTFGFQTGAEYLDVVFTCGTDFTSVETLRELLQFRTVNGAHCYVNAGPDYFTIAWDYPPLFLIPFPIGGSQWAEIDGSSFVIYDAGFDQEWYATVPAFDVVVQTEKTITPVSTRYEFDNWTDIYGTDSGKVYFHDRQHQPSADSCASRLLLQSDSENLPALYTVDVSIEPSRITWADYAANSTVPIPHQYVESLLVPISRWYAMGSHRYRQRDRHQSLLDQYARALQMLGIVDPKVEPSEKGTEK